MAETKPQTQKPKVSKIEAVRQALAHLGTSATRTQIQGYAKAQCDIDISLDHISTVKAEIASKAGEAISPAPAASSGKLPTPKASPEAARRTPAAKSTGISIEDILKLRDLVQRVGADQLRILIDVVSKR